MTPTVAVVGACIAWRQWSIARNKLKLDLFDRRFAVYQAAKKLLASIATSGRVSDVEILTYLTGTREAKWLLSSEVDEYLNKTLNDEACRYQATISELEATVESDERRHVAEEKARQREWLLLQMDVLDSKFKEFLQLGR